MGLEDFWLKIKIGNQEEFDASAITPNLQFLELTSEPQITNTYQTTNGVDGSIFETSQYAKSTVNLKFLVTFNDWRDLDLAKHDIYRVFLTKENIRVRCNTAPNKVYNCRAMPFQISVAKVGQLGAVFTVPLDNPTGMAYSILNSDKLNNIDNDLNWSYGMNIPNDYPLQYRFNQGNSFKVYNPSDKRINPYLQNDELLIQIKFSGSGITIKNTTNESNWSYNDSSDGNTTFLLNGVETSSNGQPCSKNTNYGHIELEQGENEFEISGTNSFDIVFSFPFVYLA